MGGKDLEGAPYAAYGRTAALRGLSPARTHHAGGGGGGNGSGGYEYVRSPSHWHAPSGMGASQSVSRGADTADRLHELREKNKLLAENLDSKDALIAEHEDEIRALKDHCNVLTRTLRSKDSETEALQTAVTRMNQAQADAYGGSNPQLMQAEIQRLEGKLRDSHSQGLQLYQEHLQLQTESDSLKVSLEESNKMIERLQRRPPPPPQAPDVHMHVPHPYDAGAAIPARAGVTTPMAGAAPSAVPSRRESEAPSMPRAESAAPAAPAAPAYGAHKEELNFSPPRSASWRPGKGKPHLSSTKGGSVGGATLGEDDRDAISRIHDEQLKNLRTQVKSLERENAALKEQRHVLSPLRRSLGIKGGTQPQDVAQNATERLADLEQQLAALRRRNAELEQKNAALVTANASLEDDSRRMQRAHDDTAAQLREKVAECEQLRAQLEAAAAREAQLAADLDKAAQEHDAQMRSMTLSPPGPERSEVQLRLEEVARESEGHIEQMRAAREDELRAALAEERRQVDALAQAQAALQEEAAQAKDALRAAEEMLAVDRRSLRGKEREVGDLQGRMHALGEDAARMRDELERAAAHGRDVESQLQRAQLSAEAAGNLAKRVADLEEENRGLRAAAPTGSPCRMRPVVSPGRDPHADGHPVAVTQLVDHSSRALVAQEDAALEQMMRDKDDMLDAARTEARALQGRVRVLQKELDAREPQSEVDRLRDELATLQREVTVARSAEPHHKDAADLCHKVHLLESEASGLAAVLATDAPTDALSRNAVDALQQGMQDLRIEAGLLRRELTRTDDHAPDIIAEDKRMFSNELRKAAERVDGFRNDVDRSTAVTTCKRPALDRAAVLNRQAADTAAGVSVLREELAFLRGVLTDHAGGVGIGLVQDLQEEIARLKDATKSNPRELAALQDQLRAARDAVAREEQRRADLERALDRARRDCDDASRRAADIADRCAALEADLADALRRLAARNPLEDRVASLEAQLDDERAAHAAASREAKDADEKIQMLLQALKDTDAERRRLAGTKPHRAESMSPPPGRIEDMDLRVNVPSPTEDGESGGGGGFRSAADTPVSPKIVRFTPEETGADEAAGDMVMQRVTSEGDNMGISKVKSPLLGERKSSFGVVPGALCVGQPAINAAAAGGPGGAGTASTPPTHAGTDPMQHAPARGDLSAAPATASAPAPAMGDPSTDTPELPPLPSTYASLVHTGTRGAQQTATATPVVLFGATAVLAVPIAPAVAAAAAAADGAPAPALAAAAAATSLPFHGAGDSAATLAVPPAAGFLTAGGHGVGGGASTTGPASKQVSASFALSNDSESQTSRPAADDAVPATAKTASPLRPCPRCGYQDGDDLNAHADLDGLQDMERTKTVPLVEVAAPVITAAMVPAAVGSNAHGAVELHDAMGRLETVDPRDKEAVRALVGDLERQLVGLMEENTDLREVLARYPADPESVRRDIGNLKEVNAELLSMLEDTAEKAMSGQHPGGSGAATPKDAAAQRGLASAVVQAANGTDRALLYRYYGRLRAYRDRQAARRTRLEILINATEWRRASTALNTWRVWACMYRRTATDQKKWLAVLWQTKQHATETTAGRHLLDLRRRYYDMWRRWRATRRKQGRNKDAARALLCSTDTGLLRWRYLTWQAYVGARREAQYYWNHRDALKSSCRLLLEQNKHHFARRYFMAWLRWLMFLRRHADGRPPGTGEGAAPTTRAVARMGVDFLLRQTLRGLLARYYRKLKDFVTAKREEGFYYRVTVVRNRVGYCLFRNNTLRFLAYYYGKLRDYRVRRALQGALAGAMPAAASAAHHHGGTLDDYAHSDAMRPAGAGGRMHHRDVGWLEAKNNQQLLRRYYNKWRDFMRAMKNHFLGLMKAWVLHRHSMQALRHRSFIKLMAWAVHGHKRHSKMLRAARGVNIFFGGEPTAAMYGDHYPTNAKPPVEAPPPATRPSTRGHGAAYPRDTPGYRAPSYDAPVRPTRQTRKGGRW